jgi:hypothetical protein
MASGFWLPDFLVLKLCLGTHGTIHDRLERTMSEDAQEAQAIAEQAP